MVTFTSAAKRSIRHDLRTRARCGQRGKTNKTVIPARFPYCSHAIHHCFIKIEKACLYTATRNSFVHGSMADYSSCCGSSTLHRKPSPITSMSQCRWLPYYRSHYSHRINAVGGLILSYCLCKRCKRNAVVQRMFFCCERGSDSEQRRLLRLDVTFIRFMPLQSY